MVLTHDVMNLPENLGLNAAIRVVAQERAELRWVHLSHISERGPVLG